MSSIIKKIEFINFRNYEYLSLQPSEEINIIIGKNAVGKTNIIEGIQLLTSMQSFKNPQLIELIFNSKNEAKIKVEIENNSRLLELEMKLKEGKRLVLLNGKKKTLNEVRTLNPSVIFTPDDLNLIKGSSRNKRNEFDLIGSQVSLTYGTIKEDYEKLIRQKNILLKNKGTKQQIDAWNSSLISLGSLFFIHRIHLFEKIKPFIIKNYYSLSSGEEIDIAYIPSWENFHIFQDLKEIQVENVEEIIRQTLTIAFEEEIKREMSLIGPQKDEIEFFVENKNIRKYGSQGQQRTAVLAIKLAEIEFLHSITNNYPILLLDDVMSELDESRREALFNNLSPKIQTFITTTNLNYFSSKTLEKTNVICIPEDIY